MNVLKTAAALAFAFAFGPAAALVTATPAAAQPIAPGRQCHVSLFGTITSDRFGPNGRFFTLKTLRSDVGYIHVRRDVDTRVNWNGFGLRPGVFAGVYGCFTPGERAFAAEEITLAANPQSYDGYRRPNVTLHAVVVSKEPGRILIHTPEYGYLWVYSSQRNVSVGEHVIIRGTFNPMQSSFDAARII